MIGDLVRFDTIDDFWHWIHAIEDRQINLSHSFMAKNRCRSCGSIPTHYYNTKFPGFSNEPRHKTNWKIVIQNDFTSQAPPSSYIFLYNASSFAHVPNYKGYNPRLHRTDSVSTNMREYVICDCGNTKWAFSDMYSIAPEKISRRAKSFYPHKLKYF